MKENSNVEPTKLQLTQNSDAIASSRPNIQPRYIRLPKPGQLCPFTGLSRTNLYWFLTHGQVKSISLRRPGTSRGVRLIDFDSLCAAIRSFEASEQ
jgi:hypothetical protein